MKHILACWLFCLCVIILAGCRSYEGEFVQKSEAELEQMESLSLTAQKNFSSGELHLAEKIIKNLSKDKTVSQPLYQLEHLSVLLLGNRHDEAHKLMEGLRRDFELLFDKDAADKAVSVWHGEVNKVYKGDAYERATFYAFMALSFIRKGNYEDAVRCVKNGLLADADSNKEGAVEDYALLYYLGFFASKKMGRNDEALEYLRGMNSALQLQGCKDQKLLESRTQKYMALFDRVNPNVILVVWTGTPPTILRHGSYKEIRSVIHGQTPFDAMALSVGSGAYVPFVGNAGNIDYQATTRGGRLMDNVLADKAAAKTAMEVSGNIFLVAGYACLQVGAQTLSTLPVGVSFLGAGLGCFIIGGACHIVGSCMNPAADGRYWKNLPGQLYLIPMNLPAGKHKLMLAGFKNSDRAGSTLFNIEVPEKQGVSVIHLPMMQQGLDYKTIFVNRFNAEREAVASKAASQRMSKEIK